jgi:hypothetical protein
MQVPNMLRFADLKERGIVSSWENLSKWIEREGFPPGRMLGPNTRAWTDAEIASWIESRPVAPKDVSYTLTERHPSRRRKAEVS